MALISSPSDNGGWVMNRWELRVTQMGTRELLSSTHARQAQMHEQMQDSGTHTNTHTQTQNTKTRTHTHTHAIPACTTMEQTGKAVFYWHEACPFSFLYFPHPPFFINSSLSDFVQRIFFQPNLEKPGDLWLTVYVSLLIPACVCVCVCMRVCVCVCVCVCV